MTATLSQVERWNSMKYDVTASVGSWTSHRRLKIPDFTGHVQLEEELGRGGYGVVYKVRLTGLERSEIPIMAAKSIGLGRPEGDEKETKKRIKVRKVYIILYSEAVSYQSPLTYQKLEREF